MQYTNAKPRKVNVTNDNYATINWEHTLTSHDMAWDPLTIIERNFSIELLSGAF